MRLFRAEPMSVEDEAAAVRLMAVASRTKAAQPANPAQWIDEPAEPTEDPQAQEPLQ